MNVFATTAGLLGRAVSPPQPVTGDNPEQEKRNRFSRLVNMAKRKTEGSGPEFDRLKRDLLGFVHPSKKVEAEVADFSGLANLAFMSSYRSDPGFELLLAAVGRYVPSEQGHEPLRAKFTA